MAAKKKVNKVGLDRGDRSLHTVAVIISIFFGLLILFPFALTVSNAMKDEAKIYDTPPKVLPDSAQSLEVVLNYDKVNQSGKELQKTIKNDATSVMYGVYTKMNRDSVFETKVYGVKNGKTVYYERAHKVQLQLEHDYGIYKGVVLNNRTLFRHDRAVKLANTFDPSFNQSGVAKHSAPTANAKGIQKKVVKALDVKFPTTGAIKRTTMKRNNWLLLESFKHYMKLPQFVYGNNPTIRKYGFMTFVFNTAVVIGFAIVSQVFLCSICAFVISRLLSRRAGNWVLIFFLGTMMVPFVSIMLPQLIMYKEMGAYNNYAALLLPFLYPYGFFVFLFKGFFDQIPGSYFEAARLDGASNFYLYSKICMPLSKPIIAMIALQTFLGNWNDFFWAWLVSEKQSLWTLNVALYNIANNGNTKQNALMGIAFVTILPVILATILFSKQLKTSIMNSGVKG